MTQPSSPFASSLPLPTTTALPDPSRIRTQIDPSYRFFLYFQTTQFWQLTIEPFHRRVVAPLRMEDYFLTFVGVIAICTIKKQVSRYSQFYAKPLGILGAACCLGTVYHVVNRHIDQHFNEIARNTLLQLRVQVVNATSDNTRELNRLVLVLRRAEFNHLTFSSSLATILESATTFIKNLAKTDIEQGARELQRQALLTDIDALTFP